MRYAILSVLLIAMLPAAASADRGRSRGHQYDRGDRYHYRDRGHDRGRFDISFGFGNRGHRDYSYFNLGYREGYDYRSRYSYAPRVYHTRVYAPPPVVYYPAPVYHYDSCGPRYYYRESYYYGR